MTTKLTNQEQSVQNGQATGQEMPDTSPVRTEGVPPDDGEGGRDWLRLIIDANPLYLLSVLMMIAGLYLIGDAASERSVDVETVAGFFGVQNVYEIVLVAMAIYLLRTGTNSRHGKLLLIFVMIFLADLTFYQMRITTMDLGWAFGLSLPYLLLGAAKVGAVIWWLEIKVRWERLVYPLCAFGMIYFAPQYLHSVINSTGAGRSGIPFSGQVDVYMIWLFAAAIQLPVIVGNWRRSNLEEEEPNRYFGDATTFSWAIMLFPFAVLPFQLQKNVVADAVAGNSEIGSLGFIYVPYLLAGAFFVQSFFRKYIVKYFTLNGFDAVVLLAVTLTAWLSSRTDEVCSGLSMINWYIVLAAHLAVAFTRQNLVCASFLALVLVKYFGLAIKSAAGDAYEYGRSLSTTAWAALLMAGSFISLGLGFLLSLGTKDIRKS